MTESAVGLTRLTSKRQRIQTNGHEHSHSAVVRFAFGALIRGFPAPSVCHFFSISLQLLSPVREVHMSGELASAGGRTRSGGKDSRGDARLEVNYCTL